MRLATGETTDSTSLFAVYITIKCIQDISIATVFILYLCVVTRLWRKQVYHSNLTVLLTALPVCSLIAVCMSLAMDVFGGLNLLVSPLVDVIEFAMKSGMFGGALNLPNFIIERVAATVLVDKYEKCNESFPFFSTAMVLAQIGIVTFLIYLNTIGLISSFEGVLVFGIICVASVVLFSILPRVSRRAYEVHLRRGSAISVRYQTAENVRAARLLNRLMVLYVCFFATENAYYYVIMFVLKYDDVALREILLSFFNILMVLEIFASVTVMASSHHSLESAMCPLSCRTATVQPSTTRPSTARPFTPGAEVRAIDGRQLLFNLDQEKEIYFRATSAAQWRCHLGKYRKIQRGFHSSLEENRLIHLKSLRGRQGPQREALPEQQSEGQQTVEVEQYITHLAYDSFANYWILSYRASLAAIRLTPDFYASLNAICHKHSLLL